MTTELKMLADEPFDVPLAALSGTVSREELMRVVEAACRTPSAANLQPWMFYALPSEAGRQTVADHALNALGLPLPNHRSAALAEVPLLVVVCMDVLRAKCRFGRRGQALFAIQDVAAATHNVRLAAWRLGIASHWTRELDMEGLGQSLGLSPRFEVQAALAFGRLAEHELERPPQLELAQILRWEGEQ